MILTQEYHYFVKCDCPGVSRKRRSQTKDRRPKKRRPPRKWRPPRKTRKNKTKNWGGIEFGLPSNFQEGGNMALLFTRFITRYLLSSPINERKINRNIIVHVIHKKQQKKETRYMENTWATRTHDTATGSSSLCTLVVHTPIFAVVLYCIKIFRLCQGSQDNWVLFILQFRNE